MGLEVSMDDRFCIEVLHGDGDLKGEEETTGPREGDGEVLEDFTKRGTLNKLCDHVEA